MKQIGGEIVTLLIPKRVIPLRTAQFHIALGFYGFHRGVQRFGRRWFSSGNLFLATHSTLAIIEMSLIESLPDELLLQIIQGTTSSRDRHALCSLSRRMNKPATTALYSSININPTRNASQRLRIPLLLRTVLENPSLGLLVRNGVIGWRAEIDGILFGKFYGDEQQSPTSKGRFFVNDLAFLEAQTLWQDIYSAAKTSRYPEHLRGSLLEGSESAHVVFLLMSLPNLEDLELVMDEKATMFSLYNSELFSTGKYLSKLRRLVRWEHWQLCMGDSLRSIIPAMLAPSMDKLVVGAVKTLVSSHFNTLHATLPLLNEPDGVSNVSSLLISDWNLDKHVFALILRLPRALKSLQFQLNSSSMISFSSLAAVLPCLLPQKPTLVTLIIKSSDDLWMNLLHTPPQMDSLGSLVEFASLKHLTIPIDVILGADPRVVDASKLVEVLPTSLASLRILPRAFPPFTSLPEGVWSQENCIHILQEFLQIHRLRFPHLKKLDLLVNNLDRRRSFLLSDAGFAVGIPIQHTQSVVRLL
ncbi:hypothetical protein CPB86DRAFT_797745 [Serendipita vermifera]|nr:hypothetical protein CPB86DRAFT_797745 [Serendipita vermifera]